MHAIFGKIWKPHPQPAAVFANEIDRHIITIPLEKIFRKRILFLGGSSHSHFILRYIYFLQTYAMYSSNITLERCVVLCHEMWAGVGRPQFMLVEKVHSTTNMEIHTHQLSPKCNNSSCQFSVLWPDKLEGERQAIMHGSNRDISTLPISFDSPTNDPPHPLFWNYLHISHNILSITHPIFREWMDNDSNPI